jgi:hypothetical protein
MQQRSSTYRISFTAGGLLSREAIKAASLYQVARNWKLVEEQILTNNLLQLRTQSSQKRIANELFQRLQGLTEAQIQLLVDGSRQEQNQILWLAVCKHYQFVREFAVEVVREKYLRLDWECSYSDFDTFFYAKAEWNEILENTKDSTRKKMRQVLFLMLSEAGILSSANIILPALFSAQAAQAIAADDRAYFAVFPISDADIRKLNP